MLAYTVSFRMLTRFFFPNYYEDEKYIIDSDSECDALSMLTLEVNQLSHADVSMTSRHTLSLSAEEENRRGKVPPVRIELTTLGL